MVVDDAIVVVENVERNMRDHHLAPREATIKSMNEIASSLVAVVLVMASVFIPAAFLPGTTGQLYKQFSITIVVSYFTAVAPEQLISPRTFTLCPDLRLG